MSEAPKVSCPPPCDFRQRSRGADLAEMLAVTGAWDEFDHLLKAEPNIVASIAKWIFPADDSEAPALAEAQRRAALAA